MDGGKGCHVGSGTPDASEWREDYSRGILVYTIIRMSACGPKVVENVENGMFESSNEL